MTFLDFGCVKRFTPVQVRAMQDILQATLDRDAERLTTVAVAGGFVSLEDPPEPADLLAWFTLTLEPLSGAQPFTYTPEYAAEVVRAEFSPYGPFGPVVRKLTTDSSYLFITRIDTGMTAVLGALGCT